MKPAARASHWAACLCGLAASQALTVLSAWAQTAPEAGSSYEDHYIAGGTLTPDVSLGDYSTSDPRGLARSLRLEGVVSSLQQEGANTGPGIHEDGLLLDAQWDTASYGTWSAEGAARIGGADPRSASDRYGRASLSVHERGMPFDDGWQSDNALGDLNAPLISLARLQPRFLLSQGPMQGIETEWRGPAGLQLVAGGGEPGIFEGIKVPTFRTLGGSTAALGAQWSPAPQWSLGGEFAAAHDVALYYQPLDPLLSPAESLPRINSNTGVLSAAWQGATSRVQFNVIDGTLDGSRNALGAWVDAAHNHGGTTQTFGAFRIDPNLAWGNQLITSDVQGAYYRIDYQSRRWFADFGVDEVRSVSGAGSSISFVNAAARYQLSRDGGVGAVMNLRHGGQANAWSLEAYLDNVNAYGVGRLQLDHGHDPQVSDSSVTVQQTWNAPAGIRLSSSAALERIRASQLPGAPQDATIARIALYGGGNLSARLTLDGSLQWAAAVQGRAAPATSADVSLGWQLARNWACLLSYFENRLGSWTPLIVSSPLTPPSATLVPAEGERGVFLTLRYQNTRGAHFVPLGGVPGSGSGHLSGTIYLDTNENGRFDADESGAANVTVVLDGRYSVRTDANGRFDFDAVASGHHLLTVQADSLPLPWTLSNSGRIEVQVSTRERTEVAIGALRLK